MKFVLSGVFGELAQVRDLKPHKGIDLAVPAGEKIRSIVDGVVARIVNDGDKGLGKGVIIKGDDGNYHIFGHLSQINVKVGEKIHAAQDVLGLSGSSGNSTGPHLHYGIQKLDGTFIDPTPLVQKLDAVTGKIMADTGGYYFGGKPDPGSLLDHANRVSDWAVDKEVSVILKPIGFAIQKVASASWHWFVANLPDIMGYSTYLAAIVIILGAMVGRGGMLKPLLIYGGVLILAICILMSL